MIPDLDIATAKAPNIAYDKAIVAPPPSPDENALTVASRLRPETKPPTIAEKTRAITILILIKERANISTTATITGLNIFFLILF